MGCTQLGREEVSALLERLSAEWPGTEYHLLQKNCNSFSGALLGELGVGRLPGAAGNDKTIFIDRGSLIGGPYD